MEKNTDAVCKFTKANAVMAEVKKAVIGKRHLHFEKLWRR